MSLGPPHAPPAVSPTEALNPLSQVTLTEPTEVPRVPGVKVSGDEVAEMPKSPASSMLQPAKAKDPMAVLHPLSEVGA